MEVFTFEKLQVYQRAVRFVAMVDKITKRFPGHERFGLTSQVRRAAVSMAQRPHPLTRMSITQRLRNSDTQKPFLRTPRFMVVAAFVITSALLQGRAEAVSPKAFEPVRLIVVQHNGRHKPFDSFARETVKFVTGSDRVEGQDPVETVLSIMAEPERWQARPLLSVPFRPLREALELDLKAARVSYDELIATRRLMRMLPAIVQKQQRSEALTMLDNETWDAYQRFAGFSALLEHRLELIPPPPGSTSPVWSSLLQPEGDDAARQGQVRERWTALIGAWRQGNDAAIREAAVALGDSLRALNPAAYPAPWRLRLEVVYNRLGIFQWAQAAYLLAFAGFLWGILRDARWLRGAATAAFWVGALLHAGGITLRVVLGERPPVSNFFETMLWLPFVSVALALVFERVYRTGYFGLAASVVAGLTLRLADIVPLDSSISPVVAVLRSNLWLTVHVLTIVASYGALALATVLAHVYGAFFLARRPRKAMEALDLFLYRALQVGVVLLAGGVMLGAVWANASWGRYWGWDPKETWALITLLWYLAVLHGRFAGWLQGVGVALATIGGFFLLLMTYYGVSFYLVGLHSYAGANAKPVPQLLLGYLAVECAFLCWVGLSAWTRRPASS